MPKDTVNLKIKCSMEDLPKWVKGCARGLSLVDMSIYRRNSWERTGAKHGYVDHERKYHAPDLEKYAQF